MPNTLLVKHTATLLVALIYNTARLYYVIGQFFMHVVYMNGGKRKVNKSLKAWVAFVKKVQKQEKLSYKDAIHRAKQRKDKGEKWMTGGGGEEGEDAGSDSIKNPIELDDLKLDAEPMDDEPMGLNGGRRRHKSRRHKTKSRRNKSRKHRKSRRR